MALREHSGDCAIRVAEEGDQHSQPESSKADAGRDKPELSVPENDAQESRAQEIEKAEILRLVKRGVEFVGEGKLAEAWRLCDQALNKDPDDVGALICATKIHFVGEKFTTAYQFARRAVGLNLKNPYSWGNLANIEHEMYRFEQAEICIQRGLEVAQTKREFAFLRKIQAALYIQMGDWRKAAEIGRLAVALNNDAKNRANLGMAYLGLGKWKEAWPLYVEIAGRDKSTRKMQYMNEAQWDGTKGQSVVVYDGQGIGDAISFASIIPDLVMDCKIVMDVRPQLLGLFERSFPDATVYGSFSNLGNGVEIGLGDDWRGKHQIDASIGLDGLPKFYRPSPSSCPGTPYLKADPKRVKKWKKTLAGKPAIGIAWSGGMPSTHARNRIWKLDDLLPVFQAVDATWVCLQYKDASDEIAAFKAKHPEIDLRQYKEATLTDDYDDTAALVDALDMVFSMQTAVIHLAGALGKECWCFVNKHSQWRYGQNTQTTLPWYKSVRLFRNVDGWPIQEAAKELKAKYGNHDIR